MFSRRGPFGRTGHPFGAEVGVGMKALVAENRLAGVGRKGSAGQGVVGRMAMADAGAAGEEQEEGRLAGAAAHVGGVGAGARAVARRARAVVAVGVRKAPDEGEGGGEGGEGGVQQGAEAGGGHRVAGTVAGTVEGTVGWIGDARLSCERRGVVGREQHGSRQRQPRPR